MASIQACELPEEALLRRYREQDAYTDCFAVEFPRAVTHAQYVEAFYTTWVFKLERAMLAWFLSRPSTDDQARELAAERSSTFAAWTVEARVPNQLLMCDMHERTRSWLMNAPTDEGRRTKLFFGSAVMLMTDKRTGSRKMGFAFHALLGFHKLYSRVLLRAAVKRLARIA
jgi:hypothetical protein